MRTRTRTKSEDTDLGVGVVEESLETVDEVRPVEWISTDTDTEGLPQSDHGGLVDRLVSQGAGPVCADVREVY